MGWAGPVWWSWTCVRCSTRLWATWDRGRSPCPGQRGWNEMVLKVSPNPNHSNSKCRGWLLLFFYETAVPVDWGENSPQRGSGCGISCAFILQQGANPEVSLVEQWWFSDRLHDPLVVWQSISRADVESGWITVCVLTAPSFFVLSPPFWVKLCFNLISPSGSSSVRPIALCTVP